MIGTFINLAWSAIFLIIAYGLAQYLPISDTLKKVVEFLVIAIGILILISTALSLAGRPAAADYNGQVAPLPPITRGPPSIMR